MSMGMMDRSEKWSGAGTAGDYFVVVCVDLVCYEVTSATAAEIMRQLSRRWSPRWIGFVDLHGARVRVRSSEVSIILESTEAIRRRARAFSRARSQEDDADRPSWEGDD